MVTEEQVRASVVDVLGRLWADGVVALSLKDIVKLINHFSHPEPIVNPTDGQIIDYCVEHGLIKLSVNDVLGILQAFSVPPKPIAGSPDLEGVPDDALFVCEFRTASGRTVHHSTFTKRELEKFANYPTTGIQPSKRIEHWHWHIPLGVIEPPEPELPRGVWVEFADDHRRVVDILHEPKDADLPDCYVWCEETARERA